MFVFDIPRNLLLIFALSALLLYCGQNDPDREANRLFVEAYQLTEQAIAREDHDPVEASRNYRKALDNIDKIIQDYSETQIAVNVTQQQTRIGDLTIGELRARVPRFEERAAALDDFEKLARYLISREENELRRAEYLIRLARWAYRNDNTDLFLEVMNEVRQKANRHWSIEITDPVYHQLVVGYTDAEYWDLAMESADLIQGQTLLYRSLTEMISGGLIRQSNDDGDVITSLTGYIDYLNSVQQINIIRLMAQELFVSDQYDKAVALAEHRLHVPDEQARLDYIEALIELSRVYSVQGAYDTSWEIINLIREQEGNYAGFAIRNLATELARRRNTSDAIDMIDSIEHTYFRHTAKATVSVQMARNGMVSDALTLLNEIDEEVYDKLESQIEIAFILSEYGDYSRADSLIAQSRNQINTVGTDLQRSRSVIRIADIYIFRDKRSEAAELLESAELFARQITGGENINSVLSDIFKLWIVIGRPDRALDVAAYFQMQHDSSEELMYLLLTHAINHEYHDLARAMAGMTERRHYYLYRLNSIYLQQRKLDRAIALSYEIRSYYWRAHAQADLAESLKSEGRFQDAEKAASDAFLTIQRIRDESELAMALQYVASRLSAAEFSMNEENRSIVSTFLPRFTMQ